MENPLAKLVPQYFGEYPKSFQRLFESVSLGPDQNKKEVESILWKAYEFGSRFHDGQKRLSGEPYFSHCIEVANTLAKWNMDTTTIIAGLLHDTLEDTEATLEDLTNIFGNDLGSLVNGLTKLKDIKYLTRKEKQAGNFMKLLLSVAQDLRVVIIKFADRIHNMETITHLPKIKRHRIALETRDIYIPLAHRMGMSSVKSQLEDLVFQVLSPKDYREVKSKVKSSKKQRMKFVNEVIKPIEIELNKYEIFPDMYGRAKSYASIYQKMITRNKSFEEIFDLHALRIIVQKPEQCYLALGLVHNIYLPVQERFKDFIATPKTNGYQSIHTTIIGPGGKMVEIQIRTKSMEETAEIGVAAHWVYKDGKSSDIDNNIKWLRELLEILKNESANPKEFMELLKIDLYDEEIFAFTPLGDLIRLPSGSTTVDFAFQVHTQIGMHCMGAKINHLVVPLNTKIKNGDVVEILTSKKQNPSIGWQKFVITSKARNEINRFVRKEMDEDSIKLGEEVLIKTMRRMKSSSLINDFKNSYARFGYADTQSMLKAIGTGVLTVRDVFKKLKPKQDEVEIPDIEDKPSFYDLNRGKIVLDGIENLLVNFGKCCNPIPGDDLIGFVTRGRGVTVHQSSCKSLPILSNESDRLLPVHWNVKSSENFNVHLKVTGLDYKGWLKDVSECISKENVNITSVDIKAKDSIAQANIIVQVKNNRQLNRLVGKITKLKNIDYVERIGR
tara:strand:- start:703 stop:2880 length:2178 start_codon:yes stop_codon:yes gene_type:complete